MILEYHLKTQKQEMINIHRQLQDAIEKSGILNGTIVIYCPHTTAAITINENADPDVQRDLLYAFDHFFPDQQAYRHFEGNSSAHLKSSLVGVSETILLVGGRALLGQWQSPYFCEFDGPRSRHFFIQIQPD